MLSKFIRKIILLYLCILSLYGCKEIAWGVLSEEQMKNIAYDLILLEASSQIYNIQDTSIYDKLQESVFFKHGVSKEKYQKSLQWYAKYPSKLESIYDIVSVKIDSLRSDVDSYKFHPEEMYKLDSLLDTVHLIAFDSIYIFDKTPQDKSLRFDVKSGVALTLSDIYVLTADITATALDTTIDTLKNSTISLSITYNNSKRKNLKQPIIANGRTYRYKFFPQKNDTTRASKIHINLLNSTDSIKNIRIENISFIRIFNSEKYPSIELINRNILSPQHSLEVSPLKSTKKRVFENGKAIPRVGDNNDLRQKNQK